MQKDELNKYLLKKRPHLSKGSLKTYVSLLINLYKKMESRENLLTFFKHNHDATIEYIENNIESNQSKKTNLSALYILTDEEKYKEAMQKYSKIVIEKYKENKTAENREKVDISEIEKVFTEYKEKLNNEPSINNYIDFMLVALYSGMYIPPRRAMDYRIMKWKNVDKDEDNYIDIKKKQFCFNKYKTARITKQNTGSSLQCVKIPDELLVIIKKWLKLNQTEHLIYNPKNSQPFTSSAFTKKINSLFGGNIGIDQLRSIYITNLYKDIPAMNHLEEQAKMMGNSVSSSMLYYKKTDVENDDD